MDANAPGTPTSPPPPPGDLAPGAPLSPTAAVRAGWRTFASRPGGILLAWLLFYVIVFLGEMIPLLNVPFFLLVLPALIAGAAGYVLRAVRGERPSVESLFDGFKRWPSATGAVLLLGLVQFAMLVPFGAVCLATIGSSALTSRAWMAGHEPPVSPVGIAVMFGTFAMTYPFMVWWLSRAGMLVFTVMEPDRPGVMIAFQRAWELTRGSVWRLIGLGLLGFLVTLLGLLALFVGIIPAALVMYLAWAHAYEQLRARRTGAPTAAAVA